MKFKLITLIAFLQIAASCSQEQVKIQHLSVETLQEHLAKDTLQLIDVRTPEEYAQGHIPGAKLINVYDADFIAQVAQNFNKETPVYVYCRSGKRSVKAAKLLRKAGFQSLYNLKKGYNAWAAKE